MTYTPTEIAAYRQSFDRRMIAGEDAAYQEYWLWISALSKLELIPCPDLYTKPQQHP
jgi:hypothetical protein